MPFLDADLDRLWNVPSQSHNVLIDFDSVEGGIRIL